MIKIVLSIALIVALLSLAFSSFLAAVLFLGERWAFFLLVVVVLFLVKMCYH